MLLEKAGGIFVLILVRRLQDLRFRDLMQVYEESNRQTGAEEWPRLPEAFAQEMAEQSFREYLKDVFFPVGGAFCAIWESDGQYVSALRMEPYQDGLLLEGLETAPNHRKMGYGMCLVKAVLEVLAETGSVKVYSHVSKKNIASRKLHEKCGFQLVSDTAVYIDGSVSSRACTYLYHI